MPNFQTPPPPLPASIENHFSRYIPPGNDKKEKALAYYNNKMLFNFSLDIIKILVDEQDIIFNWPAPI